MKGPLPLESIRSISDNMLVRSLERLRVRENRNLAGLLACLAEMEKRRLYLPRGYSSLFEFCTGHLKYSRFAAGRRIAAARAVARFPVLGKMISKGRLNLHAVSAVAGILTGENLREVIGRIAGRSSREVDAIAASYRPRKMLRDRVRPVFVMAPPSADGSGAGGETPSPGAGSTESPDHEDPRPHVDRGSAPGTGDDPRGRATTGPAERDTRRGGGRTPHRGEHDGRDASRPVDISGGRTERARICKKFRMEFAVDTRFMERLEKIRELLSTRFPAGIGFEDLFMLLMDDYIERNSPEARAARRKARSSSKAVADGRSRSIPRAVRDEVYLRDGGMCTFVSPDGRRCRSRWNLQIDHKVPVCRGGANSPDNLRLLCGRHNRMEAERLLGEDHMKKFYRKE